MEQDTFQHLSVMDDKSTTPADSITTASEGVREGKPFHQTLPLQMALSKNLGAKTEIQSL
jgi:hypothetical protein